MLWSLSAVLTWLLRNGAPYCKPASSWGKQRKHPRQGSWNRALQCQHAPSPPSGHWPHTVVTKAGLPGQKGSKSFQRAQNILSFRLLLFQKLLNGTRPMGKQEWER